MKTRADRSGRERAVRRWFAVAGAYLLLAVAAQSGCTLDRTGALDAPCTHDDDCDDGLPCTDDFCSDDGVCNSTPNDANTIYIPQEPYDCRDMECQNGFEVAIPAPTDLPPDNPCLDTYCDGTDLIETAKGEGEDCVVGGGSGVCKDGLCEIECDADNFMEVCDDEEDCTEDTCNFNTGTCVNEPIADQPHPTVDDVPGDCRIALCVGGYSVLDHIDDTDLPDDGSDCTTDVCNAGFPDNINLAEGTACGTGGELVCNDSGICVGCNTSDDCDGSDTTCRWRTCLNEQCGTADASNGTPCNDGTFCNGNDSCNNGSCSTHAGNPCDGPDGDGDCSETCRENQDDCNGNDANGTVCADGTFCNGLDACSSGACSQHGGDPCNGPDGDSNCAESCDESADNCQANDPNGSACSDGTYCNGADTCSSGACSQHAGNPCDGADGDGDCSEMCREAQTDCNGWDPGGSACDDGAWCNGADTCASGSCSGHAGNPCSGHNVGPNCDDSCNESNNNCTANDANGTNCDDGAWCNGSDACNNSGTCVHSGNPCSGHNVGPNCDDSCDESNNNCTANDATGTSCDDGAWCNGSDACNNSGTCVHSGNPCPGDDVGPNCDDSCNESNNNCTANDADGTSCNDSDYCTTGEQCSSGTCDDNTSATCNGPDGDADCFESCSGSDCNAYDGDGSLCSGTPNFNTCCGGPSSGACVHKATAGDCNS